MASLPCRCRCGVCVDSWRSSTSETIVVGCPSLTPRDYTLKTVSSRRAFLALPVPVDAAPLDGDDVHGTVQSSCDGAYGPPMASFEPLDDLASLALDREKALRVTTAPKAKRKDDPLSDASAAALISRECEMLMDILLSGVRVRASLGNAGKLFSAAEHTALAHTLAAVSDSGLLPIPPSATAGVEESFSSVGQALRSIGRHRKGGAGETPGRQEEGGEASTPTRKRPRGQVSTPASSLSSPLSPGIGSPPPNSVSPSHFSPSPSPDSVSPTAVSTPTSNSPPPISPPLSPYALLSAPPPVTRTAFSVIPPPLASEPSGDSSGSDGSFD